MLVVPHGEYSHLHVQRRKHRNIQSEEERTGEKLEGLLKSTMAYMSETLHNPDSRETFYRWLFKLADVHNTGRIGVQELEMLLKGLEFDGITCEDLTSDANWRRSDGDRAQCLLDEYDTNKSGYLTPDEFRVLARAITMNYELHSGELHSDMIGGYQLSKKLNQGAGAMVRVGTTREGKRRAVMVLRERDLASSYIVGEVKQMTQIAHPHVVHMEEVFEANDFCFFVMELVSGGNLGAHLRLGPFTECQAQHFFRQILAGVAHCHSRLVFHRNLMLESVLLQNDGVTVKVGDFGNAIRARNRPRIPWSTLNVPPEAVAGTVVSSEKLDVWALGVLLYRMLAGVPPFYSEDVDEMKQCIVRGTYPALTGCSAAAADIVRRMLVTDPERRAPVRELLAHPWVAGRASLWVPSLLHEEYHADCESMSRDIIIMILHDIIRQHNIRTTHIKKDSDDVMCQALNRDLKFLVRVGSITKEQEEEQEHQHLLLLQKQQQQEQEQQQEEMPTQTAEKVLNAMKQVEQREQQQQQQQEQGKVPIESHSPVVLIPKEEEPVPTEEHLFLQFVLLEGFGIEFRNVVNSIETTLGRHLRAAALVKAAPPTCLDTKMLLQNAAVLAEQFREMFTDNLEDEMATVLMLGKTGAGKSSLANKIFGTALAEVGHGKCVTKHFTRYQIEGKPVVIYDSKGYEVDTVQEFEAEIKNFFASHSGANQDHIHVVWYVVDGTSCRFEPFEAVFCSTVLADVPKIVLVNKADLCQQSEIESLKRTIEGLHLPKCASVMPTVAVDALEPAPDRCPQCGSDDVSSLRKKRVWKCNECGCLGTLECAVGRDNGMRRVVEATQMIVPERVREAFVSGQKISINAKIAWTKNIITDCFTTFVDQNRRLAIKRVLRLLARICAVWDISVLGDARTAAAAGVDKETLALPVARQVLSMALPLLRQGRSREDIELSDEISRDTHAGDDGAALTTPTTPTCTSAGASPRGMPLVARASSTLHTHRRHHSHSHSHSHTHSSSGSMAAPMRAPSPLGSPAASPRVVVTPPDAGAQADTDTAPEAVPGAGAGAGAGAAGGERSDGLQWGWGFMQKVLVVLDGGFGNSIGGGGGDARRFVPPAPPPGPPVALPAPHPPVHAEDGRAPAQEPRQPRYGLCERLSFDSAQRPVLLPHAGASVPALPHAHLHSHSHSHSHHHHHHHHHHSHSHSHEDSDAERGDIDHHSSSSSSSSSSSTGAPRLTATVPEVRRQRFSLEVQPAALRCRTPPPAPVLSLSESACRGTGDPQCGAAGAPAPSHACLVTTAVAVAWSESLMKMHLLIVERGVRVPAGASISRTISVVQSCFDRAFASFNTDRIKMLEEKLSLLPLRDVLDSILVDPTRPGTARGAPGVPAAVATPAVQQQQQSPLQARYEFTLSPASSPPLVE